MTWRLALGEGCRWWWGREAMRRLLERLVLIKLDVSSSRLYP